MCATQNDGISDGAAARTTEADERQLLSMAGDKSPSYWPGFRCEGKSVFYLIDPEISTCSPPSTLRQHPSHSMSGCDRTATTDVDATY